MSNIRVRFAPSPTGYLHVGGLRTALYNYLFAKHHNGKFILRIEDTDQTRYVEGAVENLINSLRWAGLNYDEGPFIGGEYGPYIQSQRLDIYQKYAKELVESGHAYYCFCTEERLAELRERQKLEKTASKYDKKCLTIPKDEVKRRIEAGEPYVIRLNMPEEGDIVFEDLVRGKIKMNFNELDDQVLLKSDGFPTYHLAVVIDDHFMKISHVIRGEEWLPSTPKHIMLYKAFGWEAPLFAHLPLLLNPDKTKLSKRQGDVAVEDYMKKGYLPQALVNFVALLGWNKGDEQEIFSMEELIKYFSLERVNKAGAVFDIKKLNWLNSLYIKEIDIENLKEMLKPYIEETTYPFPDEKKFEYMVIAIRDGLEYLSQIKEKIAIFYNDDITIVEEEAKNLVSLEDSKIVFKSLIEELENSEEDFTPEDFKNIMKNVQKKTGIKGKGLFMSTRIALTGEMHGPDLNYLAAIFGKSKIISRLKNQLQ